MLLQLLALWLFIHHYKELMTVHPAFMQAMPLFGILMIGAVLPLGMQLLFLDAFADLNPLVPAQYFALCKRVYRAFLQNDGKVSSKDL